MERLVKEFKILAKKKIFWPLIALLVILLFNVSFTPLFLHIEMKNGHLFGTLIDILSRGTPLIIISLGMTLVIATAGIDISVGAVVAISAAVATILLKSNNSIVTALVVAVLVSAICGAWNGLLVSRIGVQPMVGTLILFTVGRGIAQLISNGKIINVTNSSYEFIGGVACPILPFSVFIGLFVIVIMQLLMRKTSLGLFVEAVGSNGNSSRFSGINSKNVIFIVYVICGLLAGIAGIIISSNVRGADANNAGLLIELDAILAVIIGGTSMSGGRFYLGGTIVGALFIQTLTTTIYSLGIAPEVTQLVKAIVVIAVCLIQSTEFRNIFSKKTYVTKKVAEL